MSTISVVTSVYNSEKYIGETIESILSQTFKDWEYIIIDDCSSDKSPEIIQKYACKDSRIRYIRNEINKGQCANLNTGFRLAKGKYIAHTDHDDISYPDRFMKQMDYMEAHQNCVLVGSCMDTWKNGKVYKHLDREFCASGEIRFFLPFKNPFMGHSTFFMRKTALDNNGIIYTDWDYAEDYDIMMRCLHVGEVHAIPEALVIYRVFPDQVTQTLDPRIIEDEENRIRRAYIEEIDIEDKEICLKACERKLESESDYERWERFVSRYANICGVTDASLIQHVNWLVYYRQKGTRNMIRSYSNSNWRYPGWWRSKNGMSLLKKVLTHSSD